ncbi:MAG: L-threonylcarbamoyladenylate synthase [Bacteriovoracaceae bacterium]|nr:L-threonylcarbamoyladenylate synthase [Bacteroidota bacterium]
MRTLITASFRTAAEIIGQNNVVAFPTETVYGLGANALDSNAVKKIFLAKGRPSDNPLIVHIGSRDQIYSVVSSFPKYAEKLMDEFFPGPLTLVLPKNKKISSLVTAGLGTVGVRIPKHTLAQKFLSACSVPVAAPSANLSGSPSPTTWQAVRHDLNGKIPCILKGDPSHIGLESTVVDCTGNSPVILRAGGVTLEQLRNIIPSTRLQKQQTKIPRSPGIKYRHYSPLAYVFIVSGMSETIPMKTSAYIGLRSEGKADFGLKLICRHESEYAHSLFRFFRECDKKKIQTIYCEQVSESGIGLAIMDRIRKASVQ